MTVLTVTTGRPDTAIAAARTSTMLSRVGLDRWLSALLAAGRRILAPVEVAPGRTEYRQLTTADPVATGLGRGLPVISPKQAWFPRTEPLLRITREGRAISIADPNLNFRPTIIFGARPCDAAAPEILAPLFGWDSHDVFFEQRRKNLAFVVLGCQQPVDAACFCSCVGVDPTGENSGDVLLTEWENGRFWAEAHTPVGEELLAVIPAHEAAAAPDPAVVAARRKQWRANSPRRFDSQRVAGALREHFDDPMWKDWAAACVSCGTCAFVCPTCHCFDIQEQMHGSEGVRQKNWDACTFGLFTRHTSGHNPRPDRASRWRQRLNHKFRYYPEKFGRLLCTGCGRCIRQCPAGLDLLANLVALDALAPAAVSVAAPALDRAAAAGVAAGAPANSPNIYRPYLMKIAAWREEAPDVRTLRLEFADPEEGGKFDFRVGQFGLYGALGEGESTFCIASSPTQRGYIECTFRAAGRVTRALRRLDVGDTLGFRGPYGNSFPVAAWKGKNLLFVAGGIGLPPLRSVLAYCLDHRADYGQITVVYGAKTSADLVYKEELATWEKRTDLDLRLCIDWKPNANGRGLSQDAAEEGWRPINRHDPAATQLDSTQRRYTAFVPQLVAAVKPVAANSIAIVCGPPVMIDFTLQSLRQSGFRDRDVFTTLENRMKCGLGKCGRCNIGSVYVCKEGPVFTAEEIQRLPHDT